MADRAITGRDARRTSLGVPRFESRVWVAVALVVAVVLTLAVAACGHAAQGVAPPGGAGGSGNVTFKITVPAANPSASPGVVKPQYVSGGTTQAGVTVTPQGGVPFPTTYFPCTAASCTGTVTAPVGNDVFLVSLYGGTRISPDTLLSTGSTSAAVQAGITNHVNVTFDPVVSGITLAVAPATLPAGTPNTATVTIGATDATGNTIIGPGSYVNSSGAALTIGLSTVDTLTNGLKGHATTLSSASVAGPPASGPTQVTLTYNGDPNLATTAIKASPSVPINGTVTDATLVVGASPSPTPTGCSVTSTPQPTATFYPVPTQPGNPFSPVGDSIAAGSDGNLWTSDGARYVFRVTTSGAMTSFAVPGAGATSSIETMTAGPAGSATVWFADVGMRSVGRVTLGSSPSIALFAVPDVESPNLSLPVAIAPGSDGNMWFTDRGSDYLGSIAPLLGSINEYPIATNSTRFDQGLVVLPSGQLWFLEAGLAKVAMVQISSLQLGTVNAVTELKAGSARAYELRNIAADSNGDVWFTEPASDKVARVNVTAVPITIDEFAVPTANAQPTGIAGGPDGAMWFVESNGRKLGRIAATAPAGTAVAEYSYGLASPLGLVTGPDCALWVTDSTAPTGRVAQIKF